MNPEREQIRAALRKFVLSFDLNDLPEETALERAYEDDPVFREWYNNSEELKPIHDALQAMLRHNQT